MLKGVGVALLILSHFSLISHENENNLVSLRPNYLIFIGYLNGGGGGAEWISNPMNPLCIRHCLNAKDQLPSGARRPMFTLRLSLLTYFYMRAAKALAKLRRCAISPEPSLLVFAIHV